MTDRFGKGIRSRIMSRIHSSETKPELIVKKALRGKGFTYQPNMSGSPDFVDRKNKIAIFVHGCFWHKCSKHHQSPTSNRTYWSPKIARNVARDKKNIKILRQNEYRVIVLWEHDVLAHKFTKMLSG